MATNYIQKGEVMPKTVAGTDLTSGQVVVTGALVGIALGDYAVGDIAEISLEGVYEVPKATGAISHGAAVYWDADGNPVSGTAGSGAATDTATDNTLMGYAFNAAASGDATVLVKLLG